MISEIERNISDFITRLQNVSERFSLMVDHNEVIDAALPIFTKIDKLVSMLELLPENDDGSELATPTPPKPKTRRGRKRKAAQKSDVAEEEEISPEQALRMIKTEPGSMLEGQVDMECQSIDEGNVKFDAQDPDGDYGEHDDDDDDVVEHDEVEHDDEIDHDDDGDEGDAGDDTATDGLNLDDLASKSAAEAVKQLKFPRLKTIKKGESESVDKKFGEAGGEFDLQVGPSAGQASGCSMELDEPPAAEVKPAKPSLVECQEPGCEYRGLPGNVARHLRTVHENIKHRCSECNKTFSQKYYLAAHFAAKHRSDPKVCNMCSAEFISQSALRAHVRYKHEGGARYSCFLCSKAFMGRQEFVSHMNKHMDNKGFSCGTCSKAFTSKNSMVRHTKTCKGDVPRVPKPREDHVCPICGKHFPLKGYLDQHVAGKHGGSVSPLICEGCGKVYQWRTALARHKKKCCPVPAAD